jgi:glycosyltransferase involved in cell wall biosynthesis
MINISLVIPYYNESSTIALTLDLIEKQTFKPKEVIFINSSSTDSSSENIDSWIANQVRKYSIKFFNINSDSKTPSTSKNIGIQYSSYDWIAFMDCGLVFSDRWLENLVTHLKKNNFRPNIVSGVCKLNGYTAFDMCAVAHTYGVGTNRICIPGSLVRREVFETTGLFIDNMRASYDRAWQMKTRNIGIIRITPDNNNVSYIGINFSESISNLFKKIVMYSMPAIKVKQYYVPIAYISLSIIIFLIVISSLFYGGLILLLYGIIRGYLLPIYKSTNKLKVLSSIKSILLLPIVGATIDIARLCGYFMGYMNKILSNRNS